MTFKLCVNNDWYLIELLVIHSSTQVHLKMLSTKCVYKSYIFDVYVWAGFGIEEARMVHML